MKTITPALIAALVFAAPAAAAPSVAVRVGDLDLTNARQAAEMLRRLDVAAARACGAETASVREMQTAVRRSDCYAKAMEQALTELRAPVVESLYRGDRSAAAAD
ncbi:UrcA family protein [Phenylobacterium kunshanense]|uniref:UrcA family protein n=1 Tax=Phenylobacterium kunshanense TaxID=1445034 RepID=A0A328BGD9_9CAUL|nr:UrcA family protein [Phenylobacterium kunshanense]RAK66572.1 hypothetical protein DJ019_10065 [Phenylobacterium kunshanense]